MGFQFKCYVDFPGELGPSVRRFLDENGFVDPCPDETLKTTRIWFLLPEVPTCKTLDDPPYTNNFYHPGIPEVTHASASIPTSSSADVTKPHELRSAETETSTPEDWSASVVRGEETLRTLIDGVVAGRHLVVGCKWRSEENPITGCPLAPSSFLDGLISHAQEAGITVLDYDQTQMTPPFCYVISYNLIEIAAGLADFAPWRDGFKDVLEADANRNYAVSPWGECSTKAAGLLGPAAASLGRPVLAVCRIRMNLNEDGQQEPNYSYGVEIPALARHMTVVFDISPDGDWRAIEGLLDYFVDDSDGEALLLRGSRST